MIERPPSWWERHSDSIEAVLGLLCVGFTFALFALMYAASWW